MRTPAISTNFPSSTPSVFANRRASAEVRNEWSATDSGSGKPTRNHPVLLRSFNPPSCERALNKSLMVNSLPVVSMPTGPSPIGVRVKPFRPAEGVSFMVILTRLAPPDAAKANVRRVFPVPRPNERTISGEIQETLSGGRNGGLVNVIERTGRHGPSGRIVDPALVRWP